MKANIGQPAPPFNVSDWVQGEPVNLDSLKGKVVLLEVFQVNCPGCFLYALPQAADLHDRYSAAGLAVIGIATAFEDFDLNTLDNLRKLAANSEVIGETLRSLTQYGLLRDGRLPYRIPFPLAMDLLIQRENAVDDAEVRAYIDEHLPDFERRPTNLQQRIISQVHDFLEKQTFRAQTFETYRLKGTPSHIVIDRQGILRGCGLGQRSGLEDDIQALLRE